MRVAIKEYTLANYTNEELFSSIRDDGAKTAALPKTILVNDVRAFTLTGAPCDVLLSPSVVDGQAIVVFVSKWDI